MYSLNCSEIYSLNSMKCIPQILLSAMLITFLRVCIENFYIAKIVSSYVE